MLVIDTQMWLINLRYWNLTITKAFIPVWLSNLSWVGGVWYWVIFFPTQVRGADQGRWVDSFFIRSDSTFFSHKYIVLEIIAQTCIKVNF